MKRYDPEPEELEGENRRHTLEQAGAGLGSHCNGERQQGDAHQEVSKAAVPEPENPTDSTIKAVESPDPSKSEDPWKGTHWARINLKSFGELLQAGVDDKKLDAAHFKVFLLLVTIMNESNTIDSTQDDMARKLNLKPSRFSEVLKDLAEMGWIQRFNLRKKNAYIRINPNLLIRTRSAHHKKLIEFWEAKNSSR